MQFILVPGPDGTVKVLDASGQTAELVKLPAGAKRAKAAVVPAALKVASYKFGSIAAAG